MKRFLVLQMLLSCGALAAAPADPNDPTFVVATVDGVSITRAELNARIERELALRGGKLADIPVERRPALEWQVLDVLITEKIMRGAVAAANVKPDEAKVEELIGRMKQRAGTDAAFMAMIARQGMTEATLRDELRFNTSLEQMLQQKYSAQLSLDPSAALAYYNEHPDFWKREETVKARHILVLVKKDATEAEKAEKKKVIDGARARVQGGEGFAAVAQAVSEDPGSKERGGELPPFTRGKMVPEFEKFAFSLQPGQISPVFETQYGYHFLEVLGSEQPRTIVFDEVKQRIEQVLQGRKRQELGGQMVREIREMAKVEIFIPKPPEPVTPAVPAPGTVPGVPAAPKAR
ncbi:MAG TPA: peptidylprolyl isomerase [Verrucomicrobiae bacterium]|nr:peptidylprolyl isomerase [Verrucomicrobiae bacterium]